MSDLTLAERVAQSLALPTVTLEPTAGGALHAAYVVQGPSGPVAFLRVETETADPGEAAHGLRREAGILRRLEGTGLKAPRLLADFADPPALLLELVTGTSRPDAEQAERVGPEYLSIIAAVHRLDQTTMPVPQFATVAEAVEGELVEWWRLAQAGGADARPLLRLAHRVLRATATHSTEPPVFLHGDVGAGNFMVKDGAVTAVLDWETAHLGDALEDLAWLWMRGAHTSFGDPQTRFREYEAAAGHPLDARRLDWNVALVMWKSVLATEGALLSREPDAGQVVRTVVALTYGSLLAAALGRLVGVPVRSLAETPERAPTIESRLADHALQGDLPRASVLVLEHLSAAAAQRAWEDRRFGEDARELLGRAPGDALTEIDRATDDQLPALVQLYGQAADRAAQASPKAVRRIQRAQAIGLGLPAQQEAP